MPGIDEAMALSNVLSHVESGKFEVIVFDTAPTGHMLRLLQLPGVLKVRGHLTSTVNTTEESRSQY